LKLLFKWGLELKYNLLGDNLGLLFKLALSFTKNAGYTGFGLAIWL